MRTPCVVVTITEAYDDPARVPSLIMRPAAGWANGLGSASLVKSSGLSPCRGGVSDATRTVSVVSPVTGWCTKTNPSTTGSSSGPVTYRGTSFMSVWLPDAAR